MKRRAETKSACLYLATALLLGLIAWAPPILAAEQAQATPTYTVSPVGWIRKSDGKTFIVIDKRYQPALLGVDELKSLWVFYWFDRNDSPEKRAILQVHPRGDGSRPLRGVFATRSPVRPNLIAQSEVSVLAVRGNIIEIDGIDAYADTPVLDLKP
jgi:tRNA (adenine37-N6)-methyltransferase